MTKDPLMTHISSNDTDTDAVLRAARETVRLEAAGVLAVVDQIDGSFVAAARLLHDCTGMVFVTGAGTSGAIARRMAHLFSVCGTPSVFIQAADALHGTMGAVTSGDIVVAISRGGGSTEINNLATRVKDRGATVLALTAVPDSELGRRSDVVVTLTSPPGVDPGEVIAMGSTLVTAVWGDAMALVLMRLRGYSWDRMLHTHPSGAVGSLTDAPAPLPTLALPAAAPSPQGH
ncbi:KpsF/GutQ family sugar-phosphate isomerase [Nakamurella deserti]|uniref:KpsF/GutQ family sugar-phosphate isomerase n=1 Tax=Nakamurella deserti TaxID=2164074 RepID=UPI00130040A6|nr:SIS domain-containing protein [Nakamurella deserti]